MYNKKTCRKIATFDNKYHIFLKAKKLKNTQRKRNLFCIYITCPISQPRAFFSSPCPTEIIIRVTVSIFRETVSRSRGQIRASRRRAKRLNLWKSHREGTAGKKEKQKTRRFLPPRRKCTSIYEHRPTTFSRIQEFLKIHGIFLLTNSKIRRITFISANRGRE